MTKNNNASIAQVIAYCKWLFMIFGIELFIAVNFSSGLLSIKSKKTPSIRFNPVNL